MCHSDPSHKGCIVAYVRYYILSYTETPMYIWCNLNQELDYDNCQPHKVYHTSWTWCKNVCTKGVNLLCQHMVHCYTNSNVHVNPQVIIRILFNISKLFNPQKTYNKVEFKCLLAHASNDKSLDWDLIQMKISKHLWSNLTCYILVHFLLPCCFKEVCSSTKMPHSWKVDFIKHVLNVVFHMYFG